MAEYFARVELHGARWPDDYANLHAALAKHNFTNCVTVTGGAQKRLPTGLYYSPDRVDDNERVGNAVKGCADSTGYRNEVIVIKNAGAYSFLSQNC
jgi:hypothetical protein